MVFNELDWLISIPFAHRGFHDNNIHVPENSIPSFKNALAKEYAVELDVHLLKDGKVAVFHDDYLDRMCNVHIKITTLSSVNLKEYLLINSDEHIPLLEEVLNLINGKVPILIELKNTSKVGKLESAVAGLLKNYTGKVAVQTFNPFSLGWFVTHAPDIKRGQLSGNFKGEKMPFLLKKSLEYFLFNWKSKPHFVAFDCNAMPHKRVQQLRKKNRYVLCWTIRSEQDQDKCLKYCDNIIFENFEPQHLSYEQ